MAQSARRATAGKNKSGAGGGNPLRLEHCSTGLLCPNELLPSSERRNFAPQGGGLYAVDGGRGNEFDKDAPWAWRAVEAGHAAEIQASLSVLRSAVIEGATLMEVVADGTLKGWHTREALTAVVGEPLANWDTRRGRTQGERMAAVERAIGELGALRPLRRGGWTVGGAR